ncbi:DUF4405 domain-containing protein [Azohydromonas sp.]|uniref:DUF4405 domain-containing protein n=1 Tax=Azohydromonas sp. TaxID=1872666 RepID=UPI002B9AFA42|nr:DUF4405 domain-containing protein [Azohydromonas sp.]HMM86236.1 DUF4405 domain-containing protein [Azohydromonas sp.]
MKLQREWATPLVMGAFLLSAVTGVLMFFHADSGLNKVVHEWLGWVLLGGVALHATVNLAGVKRHLATGVGRAVIAGFALLLAVSFVPVGGGDEPPFVAPVRALAAAPLPVLAQVAGTTPDELQRRLATAGYPADDASASVAQRVGGDTRRQIRVLAAVLKPAGG